MKKITHEQIRSFHLTGLGLEDLAPASPLLPSALAGLTEATSNAPASGSATLHEIYGRVLQEQRGKTRQRFAEQVRYCRDRMQELLDLDDSRDPLVSASPKAVSASMGFGGSYFDSGALAVALQTAPSPVERMPLARRRRCETTLATLRSTLLEAENAPPFWEFSSADPGAIAFCEKQLDKFATTLRAVRVARLEMESAYDPAIHDEALARFDWESADEEELAAMPVVLVIDSTKLLAEKSLTSFGRLLRSGLPMQILLTCPRFYAGDLAFLAVSHREAFVMQSSMACPEHLEECLMDMTHTLRPAVAIVATEDPAVFHDSRVFALFVYNPEAGEDWVQRFRLFAGSAEVAAKVNAAHIAALSPAMLSCFRVLPKEGWSEEQLELSAYLEKYGKQPPLAIPFIWVKDAEGVEQRAVLTRELVHLVRDRKRAWRLLEELSVAGTPPPPAVDTEAIRKAAASEAILKVVTLLTGGGSTVAVAAAPGSVPAVAVAAPAAPSSEVETMDPYIDSALCTSCNDCMKINSRMFLYNGEKQAYIADPALGTFAELVKAAEGCPGRCIHPGSPKTGDRTATPQLVARAAKFNA
jgi:ferredoxin